MHSLTLTKQQLQKMIDHVARHMPIEACGLLAGKDSKVEKVIEVSNQAHSTARYMMDPVEQLNAFAWIESNGFDLLGIFHSHPNGPETVSVTDVAEAAYAVVYVILTHVHDSWRVRGFWIEDDKFEEATLYVG
jgi:proteasome lid subunit RPN8/RPN11